MQINAHLKRTPKPKNVKKTKPKKNVNRGAKMRRKSRKRVNMMIHKPRTIQIMKIGNSQRKVPRYISLPNCVFRGSRAGGIGAIS